MKKQSYDIIGDIHGQYDKLAGLLTSLGYRKCGWGFHNPEGRKVIFLGDYIDRGPKVREVLLTVRTMIEQGDALGIMGNHEYNAICYHTPDGKGGWLRERRLDRDSGLKVTLKQFEGREAEWGEWLFWMRRLPVYLDLGDLRAVHACWDGKRIKRLKDKTLADDGFLHASAQRGTPLHRALDNTLKGPEMRLSDGHVYRDKEGIRRHTVRVRWWDLPDRARVSHLAMPEPFDVPGDAAAHELLRLPNYGVEEPPVFFGHYWLPPEAAKAPLRHNIACLDFSAARQGPLVAYRWDGENRLGAHKFVGAYSDEAIPAVCAASVLDAEQPKPVETDLHGKSKAELKAWANMQSMPLLKDDPSLYFELENSEVRMVDVRTLQPRRPPEEDPMSVHRAMVLAQAAANGVMPKRKPLTVGDNNDGTFAILDGTSTYGAAIRAGWKKLPVLRE